MKKYLHIFSRHKMSLALIAFLGVISSMASIVTTYYSGMFIDIIIEATIFTDILWICFILIVISLINLVLDFLLTFTIAPLQELVVYDFKSYLLNHLKRIAIQDYKTYQPSYLSKRINEDARQLTSFFIENYATIIIKAIELVIVGFLVFTINFPIGLLMVVLCPIYFFIYQLFRKSIFEKSLSAREKSAEFFQDYTEQLDHMEDLTIEAELERDKHFLNRGFSLYLQKYKDYVSINAKMSFWQGFVIALMQVIIFFVGGLSVLRGETTIGLLSILIVYFNQVLRNISYYIELARKYQVNQASVHRIDEIINRETVKEGVYQLDHAKAIHVDLSYDLEDKQLFKQVKFQAKQGQVIAIKGTNGAGKSTLLKLMTGVIKFDESQGSVIFNGLHHLHDLDSAYFRNQALAYVPQNIRFRDVTLKESFFEISDFEHPQIFLKMLKEKKIPINQGISQLITENWDKKVNNLSGGNKQIIMILRGLIKNSSLFILDEPTSNLDEEKVFWFKELIQHIKKDKIIFIVSHEANIGSYDFTVRVE